MRMTWLTTLILTIIVMIGINRVVYMTVYNGRNFEIEDKTWILGASHASYGINDALLDDTVNLSMEGESILFTFEKFLYLDQYNDSKKTIILAFSPYSLSIHNEEKIEKNNGLVHFSRYYKVVESSDSRSFLIKKNFPKYLWATFRYDLGILTPSMNELVHFLKIITGRSKIDDFAFIDGFKNIRLVMDETAPVDGALVQFYENNDISLVKDRSDILEKKFYEFIEYCEHKDYTLYIIDMPKHDRYLDLIPSEFSLEYERVLKKASTFGDFTYLDFSRNSYPSSYYMNFDHLNNEGATVFTNELRSYLP